MEQFQFPAVWRQLVGSEKVKKGGKPARELVAQLPIQASCYPHNKLCFRVALVCHWPATWKLFPKSAQYCVWIKGLKGDLSYNLKTCRSFFNRKHRWFFNSSQCWLSWSFTIEISISAQWKGCCAHDYFTGNNDTSYKISWTPGMQSSVD